MYSKGKKQTQCEKINERGNIDRISQYISGKTSGSITKIKYPDEGVFNPQMLIDIEKDTNEKDKKYKVDRTSEEYKKLDLLLAELKRERMYLYKKVQEDLNKKESDKVLFKIYCLSKFKEIMEDKKKIANYLVDIEYYNEENKQDRKDILWNCFGNILYNNLCKNIENGKEVPFKKDMYKSSSKREQEIKESRDKIKKEQEEIVKIPITETLYNYFMGLTTRKRCEKDRYILYILYVLLERFKKKYGDKKNYIRLYKGTKQKGKITAATLDNWLESKCTQKGLERLEKNGYVKQEECQRYKKISLCELPIVEEKDLPQEKILFYAESNNPLLDLWKHNGDRKVKLCEICGSKFLVVGNAKTCTDKCSTLLKKRNKNKGSI